MGVLFRTDLVRAAGLNPNRPPKTWEEFYEWCMRLSDPGMPVPGRSYAQGQRAIGLVPFGFSWLPWMQAAGGNPIVQVRKDPRTGTEFVFPMEAMDFKTPDGVDLGAVAPVFRANFDSKEGVAAASLFHRLRWAPWIVNPKSGNPIALDEKSVAAGVVEVAGEKIVFQPEQVVRGVSRQQTGTRDEGPLILLGRGEVAMTTWFVSDLSNVGANAGVNPDLLSWFPFPASSPENARVVQVQCHYAAMATNVRNRPREARDKVWMVLQGITDEAANDENIRRMVNAGLTRFVLPRDLARLGYADFLRDVPSSIRQIYDDIDSGQIKSFTEPYQGFWLTMDGALNREVISLILAQSGRDFDYASALQKVTRNANDGVMFARTPQQLAKYRLPALIILGVVIALIAGLLVVTIKSMFRRRAAARGGMVRRPWLPWMLLFPALFLIALWGYYPLFQGMIMAFQDFRIAGNTTFVGLDNFISLALDRGFWASMGRTVYYVFLTMLISFTAPIILALMLSEVPRGKIFYRTLFFLPQVTSGLVIALIWRMMYDPNPAGLLNQMVAWLDKIPGVNLGPQAWLQDPALAMICVILPGAWAGMGINSLLYLAALKSVPEDTYEACEIDAGGVWAKLRHITMPVLMPLIIINFVGAFIGTFQNMGNIFLLTFGGPGEATMVVGMRIWIEAYNNLRFSTATTMAWVLGACLIGFTFLQIQMLKRVEFRRTAD
jgi:multiple sugar transport system permease protein